MELQALLLSGVVLAQDAVPSSPAVIALGVGYRHIDVGSGIHEYVQKRSKSDGLEVDDSLESAAFVLPYFTVRLGFEPHNIFKKIPHHLHLSGQFDWTSSTVFGETTDYRDMSVSYNNFELGDAETKWSHYLKNYSSFGIDIQYAPVFLRVFSFEFRPEFGATASVSHVENTSTIDMDLSSSPILQLTDPETLQEDYDFYTETTTYASISGNGYAFFPYAGLGLRLGNVYLVSRFGYRAEHISLHVSEHTVSEGGDDLGRRVTSIDLDASGFSASLTLEIPLDLRQITFASLFRSYRNVALRRSVNEFINLTSPLL